MSGAIRFVLNGEPVSVDGVVPTTTLLAWLRYTRALTGTKEGCAEGDCGACTVGLRTLEADGTLTTRAVNACIWLLPMAHGREIVTVERLAGPTGEPHPVQAAMAEGHGSQCGFCTPGFVMSMWTAYRTEPKPEADRVGDILAGNLCRCTGYGPIVAATRSAYDRPRPRWDDADAGQAPARLAALAADAALEYEAAGRRFFAPVALTGAGGLVDLAARYPQATILSGATDVGLWVTKHAFDPETIIYTGRVAELRAMREDRGALWVGAGVSHLDFRTRIDPAYPDIGELLRRFGGTQVRAAGTVGGNIANGSPIGDLPPALIAAGATLVLRRADERREMPLEAFFLDYGKQDRRPGEIVEGVSVPLPKHAAAGRRLRCYKLSKRFDSDITAVLGCFDVTVDDGRVTGARLAFGGVAATPRRAAAAEAALAGQPWSRETVARAQAALAEDFRPITDMRAGAGYRMQAARNLLAKYFIETTAPEVATRIVGAAAAPLLEDVA